MLVEIETDQLREEALVILYRFIDFCYDNCPESPDTEGGLLRSHGQVTEACEERFGADVFMKADPSGSKIRRIEFGNEKVMGVLQAMNALFENDLYECLTEALSSKGHIKQ